MVRHHVHPGTWCHVVACGRYDVFTAACRESTNAIEENQVVPRLVRLWTSFGAARCRASAWHRKTNFGELFYKRAVGIGNNHMGYGLQQDSILGSDLVGEFYKDAATA